MGSTSPLSPAVWGHSSAPAQLDSPNGSWNWNTLSSQLLIPCCHFVGTAKRLGPIKVGARTLLIFSSKALTEDGAEAELQQLLCGCKEWQRAHTNHAHSTDAVWAYKRSTVISSVSVLLLLTAAAVQFELPLKHRSLCIVYSITTRMAGSSHSGTSGKNELSSGWFCSTHTSLMLCSDVNDYMRCRSRRTRPRTAFCLEECSRCCAYQQCQIRAKSLLSWQVIESWWLQRTKTYFGPFLT